MDANFIAKWNNPEREHRVNTIIHEWHENRQVQMDAIVDYGFGGVVTNPSHRGSYQDFLRAIPEFANIVAELEERGLGFWLYDEFGYPSGYAGGETLKGHPELEGKGFYMRRFVAYEPRTVRYHLDCESDKIIWAAKYPIDNPVMHESLVRFDAMIPVPFTDTYVEAELGEGEAFFVFCVKSAYEGSQCTHNTCSYSRYINIMDPAAVDRFIELMFEPIEAAVPGVISKAKAIFTDEPSLMVGYSREYEEWPYAIAPWVDGLFEKYEARWGESLLPRLPLLFEGADKGGTTRNRFYQLVGEIIAENYSGKLQAWCKAHGGTFSGHYLGEETLYAHVMYYGSYMSVLQKTGYPGLDVLECVPERYSYSTAKHTQMAARKMGAAGTMAEICPFGHIEEFRLAPYENMLGVMGLLYLSGVRVTNSYFTSNWEEFAPDKLKGANGYMSRAQAREFNGYIGRMSTMLEGLQLQTDVFVYYGFEDASARFVPHHSAHFPADTEVDASCKRITEAMFEHGHDFLYADAEDFIAARETGCISGTKVRAVIIPAMDVIDADALDALLHLEKQGVKLFFMERTPKRCIGSDAKVTAALTASGCDEVLGALDEMETGFRAEGGSKLMKARFRRDGCTVWMLHNGSREDASVRLTCPECEKWDPLTGHIEPVAENGMIRIPALQSVFVVL